MGLNELPSNPSGTIDPGIISPRCAGILETTFLEAPALTGLELKNKHVTVHWMVYTRWCTLVGVHSCLTRTFAELLVNDSSSRRCDTVYDLPLHSKLIRSLQDLSLFILQIDIN